MAEWSADMRATYAAVADTKRVPFAPKEPSAQKIFDADEVCIDHPIYHVALEHTGHLAAELLR